MADPQTTKKGSDWIAIVLCCTAIAFGIFGAGVQFGAQHQQAKDDLAVAQTNIPYEVTGLLAVGPNAMMAKDHPPVGWGDVTVYSSEDGSVRSWTTRVCELDDPKDGKRTRGPWYARPDGSCRMEDAP